MRHRRLAYPCNSYTSSQEFPRYVCMIHPYQSFLYGHKSSKTFAMLTSAGEESSSLSEEENTNGANEIVPDDTSDVGSPTKLNEVITKTISRLLNHLINSGFKMHIDCFHWHSRFRIQNLFLVA